MRGAPSAGLSCLCGQARPRNPASPAPRPHRACSIDVRPQSQTSERRRSRFSPGSRCTSEAQRWSPWPGRASWGSGEERGHGKQGKVSHHGFRHGVGFLFPGLCPEASRPQLRNYNRGRGRQGLSWTPGSKPGLDGTSATPLIPSPTQAT